MLHQLFQTTKLLTVKEFPLYSDPNHFLSRIGLKPGYDFPLFFS